MSIYWWVALVIHCVICGILSAYLGDEKGRSGGAWFACGFFFGILGLIAAAGVPPVRHSTEGIKDCPDCAESVGYHAHVCPHCGHRFTRDEDRASLATALEHGDADVRRRAVEDMPESADEEALTLLVAALRDPDEGVRFKAIEALAATGKPAAADALVKLLDGYSETDKRASAGLVRLGDVAVPYLCQAAGQGDELRRKAARRVLKSIADRRSK